MFPHAPGFGGPGSFQIRLENSLRKRNFEVVYAGDDQIPDVIIVIGGTKRLFWLFKMKWKGIPIVYRLDGISWIHRRKKVGLVKYWKAEYRNLSNKLIHAVLADFIIYQSEFVRRWWAKEGWKKGSLCAVIHNGVDLTEYDIQKDRADSIRLVCLEGKLDYSPYFAELVNDLRELLPSDLPMELYGDFEDPMVDKKVTDKIKRFGLLAREKVPQVFQRSIYLSLDILPACPNTVLEAMACGAPVVAFKTGALEELVTPESGIVVPYGSDPWRLGYPDVKGLSEAIIKIAKSWHSYSMHARNHAIRTFDMDEVITRYLEVIEQVTSNKN